MCVPLYKIFIFCVEIDRSFEMLGMKFYVKQSEGPPAAGLRGVTTHFELPNLPQISWSNAVLVFKKL